MNIPKIVITDVDGVLTDGGMYYDNSNQELKKFSTSDGWGVAMCKAFNIEVVVITGESNNIVARRCEKLKIKTFLMGVSDKLSVTQELLNQRGVSFNEVAFIGDDINDIDLMKAVNIKGTPANGIAYLKSICNIVTQAKGGEGAFREFVETILSRSYTFEQIVDAINASR